jgi:two-component system NarL family sensor kinase
VYRVVQQALDNIDAHASASRVDVTVRHDGDVVRLRIDDDGRGFAPERPAQATADGHFGLTSMQARIAALGGALTITARDGGGVRVDGWVPATRNATL